MFTVDRKALLSLVSEARRFANPKSTMPILATVSLSFSSCSLTVAATNLNMSFTDCLPATGDDSSICVDANKLEDVLKALPGTEVSFSVEGVRVEIKSDRNRFNLKGLSVADFPKLPRAKEAWHRVSASALRQVLDGVLASVSRDETRPNLNAALLDVHGGELCAVATDGHRLAKVQRRSSTSLSTRLDGAMSTLLPRAAIVEFLKFLAAATPKAKKGQSSDCDVELSVSPSMLPIRGSVIGVCGSLFWRLPGKATEYNSKLSDSTFPPYDQVIPTRFDRGAVIDRRALVAAFERLAIVANATTKQVTMKWLGIDGNDQPATLLMEASDENSGSEELDVVGDNLRLYEPAEVATLQDRMKRSYQRYEDSYYAGLDAAKPQPFCIGVNLTYVVASLEELSSPTVWIGMGDELTPIVFKSSKDAEDLFVVMPVRL